jgi:hypothetical protein
MTKQNTAKLENSSDEDIIMDDAKPSLDVVSTVNEIKEASAKQDSKASNLNLDTNLDSKPTEDPAPMTANTDLDSLFQDADDDTAESKTVQGSNAASTAKGEDNNPENDPFSFDAPDSTAKENPDDDLENSTFRSSANGGDNDNLSSLLPGLQNYANTDNDMNGSFGADTGEAGGMSNTEFDALFGDSTDAFGDGSGANNADGTNNNNNPGGNNDDPFASGANDGETFNFEAFMNSTDFDTEGHNAAAVATGGNNGQGSGDGNGGGEDNGLSGQDGQAFDFDSFFE